MDSLSRANLFLDLHLLAGATVLTVLAGVWVHRQIRAHVKRNRAASLGPEEPSDATVRRVAGDLVFPAMRGYDVYHGQATPENVARMSERVEEIRQDLLPRIENPRLRRATEDWLDYYARRAAGKIAERDLMRARMAEHRATLEREREATRAAACLLGAPLPRTGKMEGE